MINDDQKEILLSELRKHGIIDFACKKAGIARSSYYRLLKIKRFRKLVREAKLEGIDVNNDTAESVILNGIRSKDVGCAKYWLEHNHPRYKKREIAKEHVISLQDQGLAGIIKRTIKSARKGGKNK
ncbi:MAG: hypothetical protein WCQ00_03030 [bacterium]